MPTSDERLRQARFLFIAALLIDLAGIGIILSTVLRGGEIVSVLPLAIALFAVASGLVVTSVLIRKKASDE
ncbi:MAG TPA: hypothetical protein EYQ24_14840 [Bacteroidetes bacterium]|nr:hypothetical protein [Bacteroidota bacterium]HIL58983.1 hypothetical protein [Rhodothermales bacterium]